MTLKLGWLVAVCSVLAVSATSFAGELDELCEGSELSASFRMLSLERTESSKDSFVQKYRDEVLAKLTYPEKYPAKAPPEVVLLAAATLAPEDYFPFVAGYFAELEKKIQWGEGKALIVSTLHKVIDAQVGGDTTKAELKALVSSDSIVPMSAYLAEMKASPKKFQPQFQEMLVAGCGNDGLAPGGIAFTHQGKSVFAFCEGTLLRASVGKTAGKYGWTDAVQTDALLFTAFHELGHLMGANYASKHRPLYNELAECLRRSVVTYKESFDNEVLADFVGSTGMVQILKDRPQLSEKQIVDLIALNLSPLKNGSMFSHMHLSYGSRQQMYLGEVCRQLGKPTPSSSKCNLKF